MKKAKYLTQEHFDILDKIYVGDNVKAMDAYGSECHDIGEAKGFINGVIYSCIGFVAGCCIGYAYDKYKKRKALEKEIKEFSEFVKHENELFETNT